MKEQAIKRSLRSAIYTRVSTEEGLEQDFNSLDAQREACAAYIKSQAHEGWRLVRDRYDDGGFSGGSMDRPALQKLLIDALAVNESAGLSTAGRYVRRSPQVDSADASLRQGPRRRQVEGRLAAEASVSNVSLIFHSSALRPAASSQGSECGCATGSSACRSSTITFKRAGSGL